MTLWVIFIWIAVVGAICTKYLEDKIIDRIAKLENNIR